MFGISTGKASLDALIWFESQVKLIEYIGLKVFNVVDIGHNVRVF